MPVTPFGRTVDAVLMTRRAELQQLESATNTPANKWDILRALSVARKTYDLSDRSLTVLQALLSFHPDTELDPSTPLVIYPSNAAICERLNGMANSTMRRHITHLVEAGFLIRRDSPNGKRYARSFGGEKHAYGFDLSPLPLRMAELTEHATRIEAEAAALKHQRDIVSTLRRDLAALSDFGRLQEPMRALWDQLSDKAALCARDLRRKLGFDDLKTLETDLRAAVQIAHQELEPDTTAAAETTDMSSSAPQNEQHHQSSDKDIFESEQAEKREDMVTAAYAPVTVEEGSNAKISSDPPVPLSMVLSCCHEIQSYAEVPIRCWHGFVKTVDRICPMMGINGTVWQNAMRQMGAETAAVTLAAMLERFAEIRNPSGYLRHLTSKAAEGVFSPAPMVMALQRKSAVQG